MARAIMSNYSENRVVKEKFLGFIPDSKRYVDWYLSINKPDEKESRIFLGTQRLFYNTREKQDYAELINVTEDVYHRNRMLKIQEVVNNLEKQGYRVKTDQLSLFINYKIDNLILDKR